MKHRFFVFAVLLPLALTASSISSYAQAQRTPRTQPRLSPLPTPTHPAAADKVATRSTWSFLPLEAAKVETFLRAHPTYDGRGVIIMIFDTGVDPGVPGLLTTSTDERKVIDVRDFSGTGDVPYVPAQRSGDDLSVNGQHVLRGLNTIKGKAWNDKYYYGHLDEKRFQNGLGDLNFNGNSSDVFGVLIYEDAPGHFTAYVDSDGDHDLSDEHPVANYHEHYDTFAFHSTDTTGSGARQLTGAVNIYPERSLVSVYFDDGSHGTHVAGIASGHDIDNQKGFNGVAPGAQVIAVKFADNSAGGVTVSGSMQKAFEFAAAEATSQSKPVVVNMSFGIGSEIEGKSAMDKWLDSLLAATPNLSVCISAGNEGPGLSSVGLPGSAERVITSGAALPDDAARDLYDVYLTHPVLFDFSSRGGELAKPDIVSPGTAVSTVPDYVGGDRYNGTSMSSPYTTGCVAVLLSAMKQEFSDWTPNANEVKRAMMLTATHVEGMTPLDEGYGMINVPAAFELLSKWQRADYMPVHTTTLTNIPTSLKTAPAAFYRAGTYPREGNQAYFTIQTEIEENATPHQRAVGMQAFDLVSDEPWLEPVQSSIYRRGEGSLNVDVRYNSKLLEKPGLYSGRIWAYPKGQTHTRAESRFELLNTVVVPNTFTPENNFHVSVNDLKLGPGDVERQFFAIPAGTKAVKMSLATLDPKGNVSADIFDNEGHEISGFGLRGSGPIRTGNLFLSGSELKPGVWEVDLTRTMASEDEHAVSVNLAVDAMPLEITDLTSTTNNEGRPELEFGIAAPVGHTSNLQPEGTMSGYERVIDTVIESGDLFTLPFAPRPGEKGVVYTITLPPEDYDLFTDITCMVMRPDSSAVFNSAFDTREKLVPVTFGAADIEEDSSNTGLSGASSGVSPYLLYIRGALALPDRQNVWRLHIVEQRYLNSPPFLSASPSLVTTYPYQTQQIELSADRAMPEVPAGYRPFGTIQLKQSEDNSIKIPFVF